MDILCLNTWGGRAGSEKLLDFFSEHKDTTDVFCLQEVWSAPYQAYEGALAGGMPIDHSKILTEAVSEISARLPDHFSYFRPHFLDNYGLLMLVHKSIHVLDEGAIFVHQDEGFVPEGDIGHCGRNLQYVTFERAGKLITVLNFHGLWNGQGKGDSDARIVQSQNIVNFIASLKGEKIFMGDLNLLPDTKSLKLIEETGLRNLITEYDIMSTRTSLYTKSIKIADYAFVSDGVTVTDFKVLPDEVSDYSPLLLTIG